MIEVAAAVSRRNPDTRIAGALGGKNGAILQIQTICGIIGIG